jgi:hypothetical protein
MQREIMCSNCDPATNAEYLCNMCQNHYCSECYKIIHAPRALQNHQRTSLNKKVPDILPCQIHTDEKRKYWCLECNTPVCSDCLLAEHKDHPNSLIHKVTNDFKEKVNIHID